MELNPGPLKQQARTIIIDTARLEMSNTKVYDLNMSGHYGEVSGQGNFESDKKKIG